jgi:hypothetical protein
MLTPADWKILIFRPPEFGTRPIRGGSLRKAESSVSPFRQSVPVPKEKKNSGLDFQSVQT